MGVVESQEPRDSLQIPLAFREVVSGTSTFIFLNLQVAWNLERQVAWFPFHR